MNEKNNVSQLSNQFNELFAKQNLRLSIFDKSVIKKAIGYVNAPYVNIFSKLK